MSFSKEQAKKEIQKLVERFENKSPQELKIMNEETTKKNFILPLFRALGWDVDSEEVSAEEKISKKRVDYGFKINGITKFFLEAKKPSEDVITDADHIRQAINYSYWQSVPWAILTNFKDLIVFNAEWKGKSLSENRFVTLNYKEFIDKFDDLWLLGRESFEKNLIDEKAVTIGKKQKKEPIGSKILGDMIGWRELLTKNINKYDHKMDEETLDESVQRILDRLIFIKSCEDREIENKILQPKQRHWQENWKNAKHGLWDEMILVFREFDSKYNSKLFEEHICEKLMVDNDVISKIITEINNDEAGLVKYDFSAIPADVLGNIYEQYLGHILKKSKKSAKVVEKHAHRKEQGIYYTPTYIVDYIVKNTVLECAKEKSLDE
ncbi:MAG TPA: type I restriction endonuclease, partial [archaeon]|nr:type I restriction endonuclease [archaeon]